MTGISPNSPAALIVGAGPTGLMMALELARHSIPCRIIDKRPHATTTSNALGLQSRTLEVFDQLGVLAEALALGLKQHGVSIYADGQRIIHVSFDDLPGPYPFILILPQSQTERILGQRLEHLGIQVERQVELLDFTQDEQAVTARLRHANGHEETVTTSWLLGCDGAHSAVRHTLHMPFSGSAYPEAFALADVKLRSPLPDNEVHLFLRQDGLFAAFPMPGGRCRLIVQTATEAGDEPLPPPTLEDIQRYLNKFAPAGSVASDPAWLSTFRTHRRQTAHIRQGRVFLAGDAAHIHSPAGGQGMNTGLQDAHNLGWKLALAHMGHAPLSLLDTYETERHPVAESVLRTTDLMLKGATLRSPISQHIRNRLIPLLVQQDFIQHRLKAQLSELSINYRKSPIVAEHLSGHFGLWPLAGRPKAGDRAPDAGPLLLADRTSARLFELLRSTKHTLLLLADAEHQGESWEHLAALADAISARHSQHINSYLVAAGSTAPASSRSNVNILLDPELALHQTYGATAECLYLIRPDGYIGYRSYPADIARFNDYLQALVL